MRIELTPDGDGTILTLTDGPMPVEGRACAEGGYRQAFEKLAARLGRDRSSWSLRVVARRGGRVRTARVRDCLRDLVPAARLLVLTRPGGVSTTRLALARSVEDARPDGAYVIPLDAITLLNLDNVELSMGSGTRSTACSG